MTGLTVRLARAVERNRACRIGRRASGSADSHRGATPVRRRRRLVREPLESSQSAGGDSAAHVAARRQDRSARHAHGREALGLSLSARHGHGNIKFSDSEVIRLREYLQRGGFLHVDDNYGLDESFRREIKRVFPDRPLVDVPLTHPIYHLVYDFPKGLPKIHEHDGLPARGFGIFLGDRLAVYYSFSSDLGNGWEDSEVYHDPPELHEAALRMGVNLFVYAVTSRPTP